MIIAAAVAACLVTLLLFRIYDSRDKPAKRLKPEIPELKRDVLIDYNVLELSLRQKWVYTTAAVGVLYSIGYIFYMNHFIAVFVALLGLFYPRYRIKSMIAARKRELQSSFKQALYSLSTSLTAGKSVENAFREVVQDLKMIYADPDTPIIKEFSIINHRVENGEPIERALADFSRRADIQDVANFSDVFVICKRTGGDLVEVVRKTAQMIGEKLEMQQEIAVMIAQKKFESRAMSVIPFAIVAFLNLGSQEYMRPLYSFQGHLLMTFALVIILAGCWAAKSIMNIKV